MNCIVYTCNIVALIFDFSFTMKAIPLNLNPDAVGIIVSTLCLIHCIATPFIFLAKACSVSCCADAPIWWQVIDYIFIVISFIAIFFATKNTSKNWMRITLWGTWFVLLVTIISETFEIGLFPAKFVYIPAFSIVVLHLYNRKYCNCACNCKENAVTT